MSRTLPALLTLLLLPSLAAARPAYRKALADFFGPALPARLNDCKTCHLPAPPDAEDRPHNAFGRRLKAVKEELRRAGKPTDLAARLEAVLDEDSDGDGASNLVELLTGHGPGDAQDRPGAADLANLARYKAAWLRYRAAYPWRPFEPVRRPAVPSAPGVPHPIDAFLAAEHAAQGLTPRPEAPRAVLLRRVTLDLTGLPPTRAELHAYLADDRPDAYERVVDRLLASPAYGERWGRHWMDVWRYADWAGFGNEIRDSQRHVWRWRDWIVEALNADEGYDRMVRAMLAGDEIAPEDPNTLRATAFLARNWYKFNRHVWLNNTIEHTAKAFLGVTLNCCRCHDHVYDPIGMKEYYAFRAIFEPHQVRTDRVPGQPNLELDGLARVYDAEPDAVTVLFLRGDEKKPDPAQKFAPAVPACLGGPAFVVRPVPLPPLAVTPDKRPFVVDETLAASAAAIPAARAALGKARQGLMAPALQALADEPLRSAARLPLVAGALDAVALAEADLALAEARHQALAAVIRADQLADQGQKDTSAWKEAATTAGAAQRRQALLVGRRNLLAAEQARRAAPAKARADAEKKLAAAQAALARAEKDALAPLTAAYAPRPVTSYPAVSTGRRLALANWITDRQNPLAARVAVNHVWLRHFGQPLVPTVFDFGQNGQRPTHPALLDWLAAEFMDRQWSMKALHRLIVTSAAYRMSSDPDPAQMALDPDNRYLWRMNARRLEAEAVRDAVLAVAGRLDRTMGGPDLDHQLGLTVPRRSLYFRHAHEKQMEFLALFDAANVTECYQRPASIMPQQALALANSGLALAQARLLARRLSQEAAGAAESGFVGVAFEQVLGRPPTLEERAECVRFLADQELLLSDRARLRPFAGPAAPVPPSADPRLRAREDLVQVLLNHHDFVTVR